MDLRGKVKFLTGGERPLRLKQTDVKPATRCFVV